VAAKIQPSSAWETFSNLGLDGRGTEKMRVSQRKTGHISETVTDTAKVAIDD